VNHNPPVVNVISPAAGAVLPAETVAGTTVSASDDKGIVQIELYLDGLLYRSWNSPFPRGETTKTLSFAWTNPDPGVYKLSATDSKGVTDIELWLKARKLR
jgi:hypothetical protein